MGRDLADEFPPASEVFERAGKALSIELTTLMFEGPEEELKSSENVQPAVLAMSVACLRAMESLGALDLDGASGEIVAAGLSLGEYGAHVASGSIAEEDAIRLVRRRGELMQAAADARPGGMASVLGLDRTLVEDACREAANLGVVSIANMNSPGQIVISGETAALAKASDLCRETGAKRVIQLKVSGAFHSPLMEPARDGLAKELEKIEIRPGRFPVVANATAGYAREPDEIRRTLLDQLTSTVLFEQSVRLMASEGVTRAFELGPGKVLAGLVRRTAPEIEVTPVGTAKALRGLVA